MKPRLDLYENDNTCIKVYDPNQKKVIGVYSNFRRAADRINISEKSLKTKASNKKRIYSEYYGMEVAIRHCSMKEGDDLLIQKTSKNQKL